MFIFYNYVGLNYCGFNMNLDLSEANALMWKTSMLNVNLQVFKSYLKSKYQLG